MSTTVETITLSETATEFTPFGPYESRYRKTYETYTADYYGDGDHLYMRVETRLNGRLVESYNEGRLSTIVNTMEVVRAIGGGC